MARCSLLLGVAALLCVLCAASAASGSSPADYLVTSIPGYEGRDLPFRNYAGYITVDEDHGRKLFFWFAESQRNPASDPLVVWLNGGPGCSSLIGATQEHGPLRPNGNPQGGVEENKWSLNRVANMLFIEAPAGVGFSYSDTPSDYITNDNKTAVDNYAFLRNWLNVFPHYRFHDLWITGESYGGVYVPMLADQVINGPDAGLKAQLKGLMLGNPVIDCPNYGIIVNNLPLQVELYYWHGTVSISDYLTWHATGCDEVKEEYPAKCHMLFAQIVLATGNIDGDDLYSNYCTGNSSLDIFEQTPNCLRFETVANRWLNAIHARVGTKWTECSRALNYTMQKQNMLVYLQEFFVKRPDLKILYYSGDVDIATVPFAYTQYCLNGLHRPIVKRWKPWYAPGVQAVAGYSEVFDRYTFVTIRGAGHEAPMYQPALAYHVFSNFLQSGALPEVAPQRRPAMARRQW
ncbi:serine carboxypeptidase [Acanthamoeba castellanii str. Neff]|uniref:Carboxypeptidase n=1 Tax=Acanthamoeba castellanii (strain ATCC 30010 / Neff) TaxID=1257118 RepID=L8H3Z1_ACACF|nr:serine carboxypeptidase [Acanthamoeba castellanii str. Neff]ELR20229.1 serine carboxypeptidase [Acanthamoeba castellanii str. Neff]